MINMAPDGTTGAQRWCRRVDALAFLLTAALLTSIFWFLGQRSLDADRARVLAVATDNAQAVAARLDRLMSATHLLAEVVRSNQGQVVGFDELTQEMLPFLPGVTALSLAPGGIVRYVAPLASNRSVIGFNQLTDPTQSPDALLARDRGVLTLSGPLQLAQGGLGVVGRLPIYLDTPDASERAFWGFANVAVRLPDAFANTQLLSLPDLGLRYRLYQVDPVTGSQQTIAQSGDVTDATRWRSPVVQTVNVPNAQWLLAIEPVDGWLDTWDLAVHAMVVLGVSTLIALLAHLLQLQLLHRRELQAKVLARTQDIEAAKQDLQTTLAAVPDLMMEVDATGKILNIHTHDSTDLLMPTEEVLGKNIGNVLPPDALAVVRAALDDAAHSGRSTGQQYTLNLKNGVQWFELSVAAKPTLPGHETGQPKRFVALARNITARKLSELQYRLSAQFFNGSSEGMLITNAEQRIIQVNPAFTTITGYSAAEALGNTPKMLASGRHDADFYAHMWAHLNQQGHWKGEIWNARRNGEAYPQWLSISRLLNESGAVSHYVAIFSDISRRLEQEARIRALAYYDPLTGLANRTLLQDRVEHDLKVAQRRKVPLSLLFIDLDHFKHVNDSLGHQAGDQLLIQIGQRIQSSLRGQDTVARLGGDEFMALLLDTSADGAANMARNLMKSLSEPYWVGNQELTVTLSIGIALFPDDGDDFESLYRCADSAMYRAKGEGRNRFAFFTPEMQSASMRRLQLENALRKAIDRQELQLYFQPQVDVSSDRLLGAEVLLRWQHPEWGLVSPGEFIPIAENSGQIIAIGEWVLRQAVQQAQSWRRQGLPELKIAVNLSAVQFRQPELAPWVADLLASTGLPAHCLELELTESTAMHNPEEAVTTIQALRHLGVQLALDDFGTGYSSLSYLKRFSISKLKIDQSFVQGLPDDPEDASIVETIIQMADGLDMETLAEGVETEAQLAFLRQHGCQQMQGYLVARPLGAKDFESWWRTRLSPNA
jgi:diguanylate cyclase (GGDEF)-like protein/PAS domain S-box-containing protein